MWKTLCYSVGAKVKDDNVKPIQDTTLAVVRNGVTVIVLCGADQSSKVSNFGSELIVQVASEYVADNFNELHALDAHDLKLKIFTYLHECLTNKAAELGVNFTDLATMISLVAVKNNNYIMCSLGDSVIGWYKEGKIKVVCQGEKVEQTAKYLTSENAFGSFVVENSVLRSVAGFILMSLGTLKGFHVNADNEFDPIVGEIVSTTGSISSGEMAGHVDQIFENFVIHKSDLNCSVVVMSTPKCASRYYALSDEEKMNFLKLSVHDSNSLGKVKDLDDILNLIDSGKTVAELAEILCIKEEFVKKKLNILVVNNILNLSNSNLYKKIN